MSQIVTCGQCISRRARVADAGKHAIRASELFRVASPAGVQAGHAMYYSVDGRIALCAAGTLQAPSYFKEEARARRVR